MRLNNCQQNIALARAVPILPLQVSSLSIEQACGRGTPQPHIIITTG